MNIPGEFIREGLHAVISVKVHSKFNWSHHNTMQCKLFLDGRQIVVFFLMFGLYVVYRFRFRSQSLRDKPRLD